MYAIIRIRGSINISPDIKKTFELLNLRRVNNLSIWQENKQTLKMIKKVENYATFGKIDDDTLKLLIEKRGNILDTEKNEKVDASKMATELKAGKTCNEINLKNCFRLSPPKKGFERKGIKRPFKLGGALGNRNEKINDLIKRMI
ncbi:MAG: 50S ribosomal protein L30 [Candidatus ainarchaeum sp.]|nr:50S ribosomal protein L30 [Candidatus ainarchaeum sp.]